MKTKDIHIKLFNNKSKCWEAFPRSKNHEIELNDISNGNQDQKWTIREDKITILTKNEGEKVAECYPNSNRLETSNNHSGNKDQKFQFRPVENEADNVFFIFCNTKNRGEKYVYGNSKNQSGIGLRDFNSTDSELYWIID
ncbi:hypothetical protein [Tenacibaculum xiamenense]|uniref:hypothetical protein n=1 Tax=Tenacibaculum xiamenense TaxID=1261553 RepID=UPI003894EA63